MPTPTVDADAAELDLRWNHGDAVPISLHFQDESGASVDLSAFSFAASVRLKAGTATEWEFAIDAADAAAGHLVLTTPNAADVPGRGVWDLRQFTTAADVTTLLKGETTAVASVSSIPAT